MIRISILTLFPILSACGGAATTALSDLIETRAPQTAQQLTNEFNDIFARTGARTSASDLPIEGTAVYSGVALVSITDPPPTEALIRGQASIAVSFADGGNIAGRAENFVDFHGDAVAGTLEIAAIPGMPTIDRSAPDSLRANVSGSLTPTTGPTRNYSVIVNGGFFGTSPNIVRFEGSGQTTIAGRDYAIGVGLYTQTANTP